MANLAQSAVTIIRAWSEGGVTGKERSCRQVSLVLTGQGGTTNKITADVLGLTAIVQCSNFITSDNTTIVPATPSADGLFLCLAVLTNATDATRAAPADIAGGVSIVGVVKGYVA